MHFDSQYRYLSFRHDVLASADQLRDAYGAMANTAPDSSGELVKTLLCSRDKAESETLRALELGVTAVPIPLSNGSYCLGGFWSKTVIAAFESGEINGEELTANEVKTLSLTEEI